MQLQDAALVDEASRPAAFAVAAPLARERIGEEHVQRSRNGGRRLSALHADRVVGDGRHHLGSASLTLQPDEARCASVAAADSR
eukprot:896899-Prymnesium_polylepis.2